MHKAEKCEETGSLKPKVGMISEGPEVEKYIETEMIRSFELTLYDYHQRRLKKQQRWLNVLSWPCISLVKAEGRSSLKIPYLYLCVYLNHFLTLSFTPRFHTFHSKEKEANYIFIHKSCCLFWNTTSHQWVK